MYNVPMHGQTVFVQKNPEGWRYPYSVRAITGGGRYIISQHKTRFAARRARDRAASKDVRQMTGWKR